MKIPKEPVSAFAIYSKKLKKKKLSKNTLVENGKRKIKKRTNKSDKLNTLKLNEINNTRNRIMQTPTKQSNNIGKVFSSMNTTRKFNKNISHHKKIIEKSKKKPQNNNNIKNTNNKTNELDQSNKLKSLNQGTKVNLINHVDNDIRLKGPNKRFRKNKLDSEKKEIGNVQQKIEKLNSLQQKENKILPKKEKVVDVGKENNIRDKDISKRKDKINRNEIEIKPKKNKQKILQPNWTNQKNSTFAAKRLFEWLILPIKETSFMSDYWEKQPLLIQREGNRTYFSELISTLEIDSMIRKNNIHFTKHLDITSYTDQKRETHNLSGRAQANVVWDFYTNGCSVRLLNPQIFLPKIHTLNATLQGFFGCFVGANVYLTPPNSQGFAPHYDDIEAFVLQIEGKKHWKVYRPRNDGETLPRYSSPNFTQEEIGNPILDVTLEPGDMLYFPRGYIHQASTVEGEHSLHITLSAYQKTSWIDLLEKAIPIALERAAAEDVEFRKGLPRDYLGIEFHGSDMEKDFFTNTAQRLMCKVAHFLQFSLGAGVDKMGAQFMHDALPPVFTPEEKQNMVLGSGLKMKHKGKLAGRVEFEMDTEIKLVRANVCRLIEEEGELRLYHCLDNPLEYHAENPQFLVLPTEGGQVITQISTVYPAFIKIQNLPHTDKDTLLALVSDLWDAGLLVTKALPNIDEEN